MTQYFSKPFCEDINVKIHLSNYAKEFTFHMLILQVCIKNKFS